MLKGSGRGKWCSAVILSQSEFAVAVKGPPGDFICIVAGMDCLYCIHVDAWFAMNQHDVKSTLEIIECPTASSQLDEIELDQTRSYRTDSLIRHVFQLGCPFSAEHLDEPTGVW